MRIEDGQAKRLYFWRLISLKVAWEIIRQINLSFQCMEVLHFYDFVKRFHHIFKKKKSVFIEIPQCPFVTSAFFNCDVQQVPFWSKVCVYFYANRCKLRYICFICIELKVSDVSLERLISFCYSSTLICVLSIHVVTRGSQSHNMKLINSNNLHRDDCRGLCTTSSLVEINLMLVCHQLGKGVTKACLLFSQWSVSRCLLAHPVRYICRLGYLYTKTGRNVQMF